VWGDTIDMGDTRVKAIKAIVIVTAMSNKKGRQVFQHIGVTPSVAAPGVILPSDATVTTIDLIRPISAVPFSTFSLRVERTESRPIKDA